LCLTTKYKFVFQPAGNAVESTRTVNPQPSPFFALLDAQR